MGSFITGIIAMILVGILVFLALATQASPFIGFGVCVVLGLLGIGLLVDIFGRDVADIVARVILVLIIIAAVTVFMLETFYWGERRHGHKVHVSIGQTSPDTVLTETHDPDDDPYDPRHLTPHYGPGH